MHRRFPGLTGLSFAAVKELDECDAARFTKFAKCIDLPERVHLIERYEKRLEVLDN